MFYLLCSLAHQELLSAGNQEECYLQNHPVVPTRQQNLPGTRTVFCPNNHPATYEEKKGMLYLSTLFYKKHENETVAYKQLFNIDKINTVKNVLRTISE